MTKYVKLTNDEFNKLQSLKQRGYNSFFLGDINVKQTDTGVYKVTCIKPPIFYVYQVINEINTELNKNRYVVTTTAENYINSVGPDFQPTAVAQLNGPPVIFVVTKMWISKSGKFKFIANTNQIRNPNGSIYKQQVNTGNFMNVRFDFDSFISKAIVDALVIKGASISN